MRLRRRSDESTDPVRGGFAVTATQVDRAQRALIAAIPTPRDPGVPLAPALHAFLEALDRVEASMPAWHDESSAHEWTKCSAGIAEARAAAEALAGNNLELTFEQLNAQIGDVLYPLEAFVDAERELRRR